MRKFFSSTTDVGTGIWMIPMMGVLCIAIAWFIAFTLGQSVGDQERRAFDQVRDSQIAACERGNVLRRELNSHVEILDEFLSEAADARERTGDIDVADRYRELAVDLYELEIFDCEEVVRDFSRDLDR